VKSDGYRSTPNRLKAVLQTLPNRLKAVLQTLRLEPTGKKLKSPVKNDMVFNAYQKGLKAIVQLL